MLSIKSSTYGHAYFCDFDCYVGWSIFTNCFRRDSLYSLLNKFVADISLNAIAQDIVENLNLFRISNDILTNPVMMMKLFQLSLELYKDSLRNYKKNLNFLYIY